MPNPHKALSRAREAIGLGTRHVAALVEVSPQQICIDESGRKRIPSKRLRALCQLYKGDLNNRIALKQQQMDELLEIRKAIETIQQEEGFTE